jgi:hypothetical protein
MLRKERPLERYKELLAAIRRKCAEDQWYGVDLRGSRWAHTIQADDPQRKQFAFPSATEEQLAATEGALGFPLPPLLRAVYTQIANGGFGPGYGLRGAMGGFSGTGTIVETYRWSEEGRQLIELPAKEIGSEEFRLDGDLWPDRFLSLCEWGCNIESYLHCPTGRVFRVAPVEDEVFGMRQQAATLEEWLKAWPQNESYS